MQPTPRLDDIDQMILSLLRENGRRTVADIATRVNLSVAPVRRRIAHMESTGVIAGYTAIVDERAQAAAVEAYVEMQLGPDANIGELTREIQSLPEVQEVAITAGDPDVVLRLRVDDIARLRAFVQRLRQSTGVANTKTMVVLDSWKRC